MRYKTANKQTAEANIAPICLRIPKNVKLFVVVHKSCRNSAKQSNIKLDFHNSNAKIGSNVVIVHFRYDTLDTYSFVLIW